MPGIGYSKELAELIASYGADWKNEGVCADMDPNIWFPEHGQNTLRARKICSECPVRAHCLEFAVMTNQKYGVWGGASEDEREVIRKKLRAEGRL